jgi:exocyst complex component 4
VVEDLSNVNPEENSFHFIVILIKCLALLDKLPFAVNRIKDEMQVFLLAIVQRTTQHIKDFSGLQTEVDYKHSLKELVQTLFDQFKEIAEAHAHFSRNVEEAAKVHGTQVKTYTVQFYWAQVQCVVSVMLLVRCRLLRGGCYSSRPFSTSTWTSRTFRVTLKS